MKCFCTENTCEHNFTFFSKENAYAFTIIYKNLRYVFIYEISYNCLNFYTPESKYLFHIELKFEELNEKYLIELLDKFYENIIFS